MRSAGEPADCPRGHSDTVKLLSTVSLSGGAEGAPPAATGGGCCGGTCGCGN